MAMLKTVMPAHFLDQINLCICMFKPGATVPFVRFDNESFVCPKDVRSHYCADLVLASLSARLIVQKKVIP